MRSLPLLVTPKNKLWLAFFVGMFAVFIYGVTGRIALTLGPRELPFSAIDYALPLIPWTFWIYCSVYFIYVASCFIQRDLVAFSKFLYGYMFAYLVSSIFFVVFPTTFPRDAFPISPESGPITQQAFAWFRTIDLPTNCFPSMHVGSAVMATMPFYGRRPRVFLAFCGWATLIGVTTVTTKQHYAVDVLAGAAFGLFSHVLAFRWLSYEPETKSPTRGMGAAV